MSIQSAYRRAEKLREKLRFANSTDPELQLDEESVEKYQAELETIERALSRLDDRERD